MWSKFLRNLASFDSVDKMGLSRLSDSCKIHHICSKDSSKFTNKAHTSSSVRHIEFFVESRLPRVHPRSQSRSFFPSRVRFTLLANRRISRRAERAPGKQVFPDHFQTVLPMLVPD